MSVKMRTLLHRKADSLVIDQMKDGSPDPLDQEQPSRIACCAGLPVADSKAFSSLVDLRVSCIFRRSSCLIIGAFDTMLHQSQ
jgi:hypothetical protein